MTDPTGEQYGLPTYRWNEAPAGLATRRQLSKMGLRKGGQPIAAQLLRERRRDRPPLVAYLYRVDLALPKRPMTEAKIAAVWIAAHSRKHCTECQRRWPELTYVPRFGICEDCRESRGGTRAA